MIIWTKTNFQRYTRLQNRFSHAAKLSLVPRATHPHNNPFSTLCRSQVLETQRLTAIKRPFSVCYYVLIKIFSIYFRPVLVQWGYILILYSALQRESFSCEFVPREFIFHTPPYVVSNLHVKFFLVTHALDWIFHFSTSSQGFRPSGKTFSPWPRLTQGVFPPCA